MVPASQVFSHQSLLDVLGDVLIAPGHLAVPGWPHCCVWVLRHAVYLVSAVVYVHVMVVISWGGMVGRIDVIVSLHLVVVHVDSIGVRLRLCVTGIACDVIGSCGWSGSRLIVVAVAVRLS